MFSEHSPDFWLHFYLPLLPFTSFFFLSSIFESPTGLKRFLKPRSRPVPFHFPTEESLFIQTLENKGSPSLTLAGPPSSYLVEMRKHIKVLNWRLWVKSCPSAFSLSWCGLGAGFLRCSSPRNVWFLVDIKSQPTAGTRLMAFVAWTVRHLPPWRARFNRRIWQYEGGEKEGSFWNEMQLLSRCAEKHKRICWTRCWDLWKCVRWQIVLILQSQILPRSGLCICIKKKNHRLWVLGSACSQSSLGVM